MERKKKKWTDAHPIGHFNKARVLNLLKQNWRTGLKQNEIIEKSKLSKPTVSRILQELLSEHKIFQLNNLYFPEFGDDFIFGYFFSDYINLFLTKIMENKKTISNLMDTPYNPKFAKEPLDNSIFEFANTIGGLITYILIESSSLYADDREDTKIKELIDNIFKGIIWNNIFHQFGNLFRDSCEYKETRNHEKGFNMLKDHIPVDKNMLMLSTIEPRGIGKTLKTYPNPNLCLPGGQMDSDDVSPDECMRREIYEELSIHLDQRMFNLINLNVNITEEINRNGKYKQYYILNSGAFYFV